MPKGGRDHSASVDGSWASPLPCSSSQIKQSITKNAPESEDNLKEWEEARCAVCMEHPHNAVLLTCSSLGKGCRPYMCDTSHRHSNCLDQFKKSFSKTPENENTNETTSADQSEENDSGKKLKLVCPLCRGKVTGWTVVDSARSFMNAKTRSCASETCDFCGTYADLRKHARKEHPLVRPSEADPERQRNWGRLERQRDFGDLISSLQSLGEETSEERENLLSFEDGGWLTMFFLIRVFRPENSSWGSSSRTRAQVRVRRRSRRQWGETEEGENVEPSSMRDGDDVTSDGGESVARRVRRRLRRRSTQWGETEGGENMEPSMRESDDLASEGGEGVARRVRRRLRQQSTPDDEI